MKFSKPWKALVPGDKYESDFFAGGEVPKGLEEKAIAAGVAEKPKAKKKAD